MRKTIIVATATMGGFVSAAQAQSSVILYGLVDAPIEFATNQVKPGGGSGNLVRMPSGGGLAGSRWGLRGTEDLGGGNQAVFVLENQFAVDNGNALLGGRLFGRQAYVGLSNTKAGSLTLGRQYTSMFLTFANFSPTAYAPMWEPLVLLNGLNLRSDNTVKYSVNAGPLSAQAHWSFGNGTLGNGEVPGQFRRDSGFGGGATYFAGKFAVGLAYDQFNPSVTGGTTAVVRKAGVAVNYSIGNDWKLFAGYRWGQALAPAGLGSAVTQNRDDYYWLGANYQATAALQLTLGLSYDNLKSMAVSPTTTVNPANPWQVQLLADYSLSKRTDVYLMTAYAKNAGLGLDNPTIGFAVGYTPAPGKTNMLGVAMGVRHKF